MALEQDELLGSNYFAVEGMCYILCCSANGGGERINERSIDDCRQDRDNSVVMFNA